MFVAILGSYLVVAALGLLLGWTAGARFEPNPHPEPTRLPAPAHVYRVARVARPQWARNGAAYDWQGEPDADRWGGAS
jgi:hypothetical protein